MTWLGHNELTVYCHGATAIGCHDIVLNFNSLAPGKFEWNFRYVIFKQILIIDGWGICCEIVLIWMSLDFTDDQSTLVQLMAWCHQATTHYLSQCWPRSLSPFGVTRPQWVNNNIHWPILSILYLSDGSVSLDSADLIYTKFCRVNWLEWFGVVWSIVYWLEGQGQPYTLTW